MSTVIRFQTSNQVDTISQFVAHKVMIDGLPHTMWFSTKRLIDAERFSHGRTFSVRKFGPRWRELEARIPGLVAQWEKENSNVNI